MGIPSDPLLDIMRRSLVNQEFIDKNYKEHRLYEITHLVNTFLGALIHPFEASRGAMAFRTHLEEKSCPEYIDTNMYPDCANYYQFIRLLRNGLCHGNIRYNEGKTKNIESIDVWNIHGENITFSCRLSIDDMKEVLMQFSSVLEGLLKAPSDEGGRA